MKGMPRFLHILIHSQTKNHENCFSGKNTEAPFVSSPTIRKDEKRRAQVLYLPPIPRLVVGNCVYVRE